MFGFLFYHLDEVIRTVFNWQWRYGRNRKLLKTMVKWITQTVKCIIRLQSPPFSCDMTFCMNSAGSEPGPSAFMTLWCSFSRLTMTWPGILQTICSEKVQNSRCTMEAQWCSLTQGTFPVSGKFDPLLTGSKPTAHGLWFTRLHAESPRGLDKPIRFLNPLYLLAILQFFSTGTENRWDER